MVAPGTDEGIEFTEVQNQSGPNQLAKEGLQQEFGRNKGPIPAY